MASIIVALIIAESAFRGVASEPELQAGWWLVDSSPTADVRILDDGAIVLRPDLARTEFYAHRDGACIVVILGDSFTEGFPFARHDPRVYTRVLETMLRKAGIDADVLAVGQGDSGPDQQVRILDERVLPNVTPNVLVWQLYANDLWDNYVYSTFDIDPKSGELVPLDARTHWIQRRQRFYNAFPLPLFVKRESWLFRALLRTMERTQEIPPSYKSDWQAWSLDKLAYELAYVNRRAEEHGFLFFPFVATPGAVFYERDQFPNPASGGTWKAHYAHTTYWRIRNIVERFPTRLTPDFFPDDRELISAYFGAAFAGDFYMNEDDPSPVGDRHYNEFGHWLLAKKLADELIPSLLAASPAGTCQ